MRSGADRGTAYRPTDDLEESTEQIGGFRALAWAAGAVEPGKLAVLIVYENTWAVPSWPRPGRPAAN
jgi:hypothetical protein